VDDQGAAEFPFVIRDVISTATPQELKEAMASQAVTVSRMVDADGQDEFWCAQLMQPVQRRVEMVDRARYGADYVGVDAAGPYVWTHYVALRPHHAGAFGPGAQGVAADFAFVVDLSLGADTFFDSSKVDWVATVIIDAGGDADVLDSERDPSQHGEREPEPDEYRATTRYESDEDPDEDEDEEPEPPARSRPTAVGPTPREHLAQEGTAVSAEQFGRALDGALATLASLTGTVNADIPRPREVKARKHSRYRGNHPSYSFSGTEVHYHTVDPIRGPVRVSTTDPGEALYWMVDDAARSLAWTWAQRAPASRMMDRGHAQWLLAAPLWLTLVTALDVRWASKTRTRIAQLRRHAETAGALRPGDA
jgi:hypothetical protein